MNFSVKKCLKIPKSYECFGKHNVAKPVSYRISKNIWGGSSSVSGLKN